MNKEYSGFTKKIAATAFLFSLVMVIVVSVVQFLGGFTSTIPVTLTADRAGLVMNPQAKVRLRGVVVGRVKSIEESAGKVKLTLDMVPSALKKIPANVVAQIKSNTVFGAKSVDLHMPEIPAATTLRSGGEIRADHVVVELNSLYQQLVDVLANTQPEKLNATIGALDTALRGKGDQIGRGLAELSQLLTKINRQKNTLSRDIELSATVLNTYANVAPNLLRTIDNALLTGNTLVSNAKNLDALLVNVTGMANTTNSLLEPRKIKIIQLLANFTPTAQNFGEFAPGLKCFLDALASAGEKALNIVGEDGNIILNASILPGSDVYRYPENLPRVNVNAKATCEGLTDTNSTKHSRFFVYDTAPLPYMPRTRPKVNPQTILQLLFGEYSPGK